MSLYDIKVKTNIGLEKDLSEYKGKVLLIVNTASKCGFTPQFKGLESLNLTYKDKGVEVLGFPCNQFKNQDPGTDEEILQFCQLNFGVTFKMYSKIDVNGENRHPLYQFLIDNTPNKTGKDIKWNFEKFLINKNGEVVKRYTSLTTPEKIEKDIKKLL